MLICTLGSGKSADDLLTLLTLWSKKGLLSPFAIAVPADEGSDEAVLIKHLDGGKVEESSVDEMMVTWNEVPTLIAVSIGRQEAALNSVGLNVGKLVMGKILSSVDASVSPQGVHVYITDGPETPAPVSEGSEWAMRLLVAPEDRASPELLMGPIIEEVFIGHAAAAVASIGGLWAVQPPETPEATINWFFSEGTQGSSDMVLLTRQYTRILDFPNLISELAEAARLDPSGYPNPSQDKFERVSIKEHLPRFGEAFVSHFAEIQLGQPDLLPPDPVRKLGLLAAARELIPYAITQLINRPVNMAEDFLRSVHDRAATFVESKYPDGLHVLRWDELGVDAAAQKGAVEDLAELANRLNESPTTTLWSTYIQLCLGLLDGSDGEGTALIEDQLYRTTEKRRMLALAPSEIVPDPWTLKSPEANQESVIGESEASAGEDPSPIDGSGEISLTETIRALISNVQETATEAISKIEEARAASPQQDLLNERESSRDELTQFAKQASRNVRSTLFGIVAWLALSIYLGFYTHLHLKPWAIVSIAVTLLASPVMLAVSAFRAWRGQGDLKAKLRTREIDAINRVLAEAHIRSVTHRIERRLSELDDWNSILGMVIHHPFDYEESAQDPVANELGDAAFPSSVQWGNAMSSPEQVRLNQNLFKASIYKTGWLRTRFSQLENLIAPHLLGEIGADQEQWLADIEGDTSLDPQSPRRVFKILLEDSLRSKDGSALLGQIQEFLRQRRVAEIADVVVIPSALGGPKTEKVENFLNLDGLDDGRLLPAIWKSGKEFSDRGVIQGHRNAGEGNHVALGLNASTGLVVPRIVVSRRERTARISGEGLNAFSDGR